MLNYNYHILKSDINYVMVVAHRRFFRIYKAASGFEPENKGFADLCLTTWLCRQLN